MTESDSKQYKVPRLHEDVKVMNGKSTKRLAQSIEALSELLDGNDEVQHEVVDKPDTLRDARTK